MDDITGLLLIGIGAMATVLVVAAMRDKESKQEQELLGVGMSTNQPDKMLISQVVAPSVTPLTIATGEVMGPALPAGLEDTLDPSLLDYIPNSSDRNDIRTYWSRFLQYNSYIWEAARITQVPNNVIRAVMIVESSVVNSGTNSAGCTGLMQLTIGAAQDMGYTGDKTGLYTNPRQNIILGSKYLAYQYRRYGYDWNDAFAAYNFGSVHRWSPGVTPMAGIVGDQQWSAILDLVSQKKITRFSGVYNSLGYGPIVNQGYVDKVNKWWRLLDQVIVIK